MKIPCVPLIKIPRAQAACHIILGVIFGMEPTIVRYSGYTGIMEKKMETTLVYRGYIGIVEKKMETTIVLSVCNTLATCLVSHALSNGQQIQVLATRQQHQIPDSEIRDFQT